MSTHLEDRIEKYGDFVKEAKKRLWATEHNLRNHDHRWKGETVEEYWMWRKKMEERIERREEVVNHLRKKKKALEEKQERREVEKDQNTYDVESTKIVTFDGRPVVESAAHWLQKSRENGWNGVLNSGYRTPEYSESLCQSMCGAPTCSGRCAGRGSGHSQTVYPGPCVDVSDYDNFERIQYAVGSPLRNSLPIDPVHFSPSGR